MKTKIKAKQHYIMEIKEERWKESLEMAKNKNALKIIIPENISNEEISTNGISILSQNQNIPIKQ